MFKVNGIIWTIVFVNKYNPILEYENIRTVGMTDWNTKTIYLSDELYGGFLHKVICHELCHVYMFSYGIHMSYIQEEILCDILATYGKDIIMLSDKIYKSTGR